MDTPHLDPLSFAYWLWSAFELANPATDPRKVGFTREQAAVIAEHLQLVFVKATPSTSSPRAPRPTVGPEVVLTDEQKEAYRRDVEEAIKRRPLDIPYCCDTGGTLCRQPDPSMRVYC